MDEIFSRLPVLAIALGFALVPSVPAWAEDSHDHHDHGVHGSHGVGGFAPAPLLDAGEQWATDTALHGIIGELAAGGQLVSVGNPDDHMIGVVRLVAALDAYGTQFDHPDWQPVDTGH